MSLRRILLLALVGVLLAPAPAYAAAGHVPLVDADILGTLGGVFGGIGHAILGAFSWTIGLASKFILTTIAALVKMLIPHSWVHKGLQIMRWIVAVPNYAGQITSPGGGQTYGFAGINVLRGVFTWLGIAIAPLALVYATSRAMIGEGDPVAIPLLRMLAISVVIASYPYWWAQAGALADQVTNTILSIPQVSRGLYKLMDYAVDGVALGGWQLVDLALMGAIGLELLGLIFLKVVLILLGALLYATGPLTIGLIPAHAGHALARAWASAVVMLLGIGIAWATVFAVGALLIGDAGTAGPLIAGNSALGSLAGGLLLAVAGLASLWLCLKAAREAGALLRAQLSGLLVLAGSHRSSAGSRTTNAIRGRTTGSSLRDFGSRLAKAAGAATGELALAGGGGAAVTGAARSAAYVGRRGLIGTAASGAGAGAGRAAAPVGAVLGRSRAGAVAARMARAGTASWTANAAAKTDPSKPSKDRRGGAWHTTTNTGPNATQRTRVATDRSTGTSRPARSQASVPDRNRSGPAPTVAPIAPGGSGNARASTTTAGLTPGPATNGGQPSAAPALTRPSAPPPSRPGGPRRSPPAAAPQPRPPAASETPARAPDRQPPSQAPRGPKRGAQ
jgi:hypothetical protein